jgi:hypothetical protein
MPRTFLRGVSTREPSTRPPSSPAAAAPPATSGAFALLAAEPTVSVKLWTTPLLPPDDALRDPPPLDERRFFDPVPRDPPLLLFARLLEPAVVRLAPRRLDAAAGRLELERLDPDDLRSPPLDVLLLFERALDERCAGSAMEPFLSWAGAGLYPLGRWRTRAAGARPHRGAPRLSRWKLSRLETRYPPRSWRRSRRRRGEGGSDGDVAVGKSFES